MHRPGIVGYHQIASFEQIGELEEIEHPADIDYLFLLGIVQRIDYRLDYLFFEMRSRQYDDHIFMLFHYFFDQGYPFVRRPCSFLGGLSSSGMHTD